ncbi:acyl-CoA N-acyltransferase [Russula earlei]|uniref:Acyl-CoA N-acyltransferase n=1 Tax=Russula earlei TaxID=71964 RepID=A0ACC0UB92_9AGAM|nr:acyl-CoA N-acyltransferase [Russula earlei]
MAYINSYKAPHGPTLLPGYYGPDPYDINWTMPLHEATLESERVKLTPFIPSLHAKEYAEQTAARPELHRWFPFDPSGLDTILTLVELRVRRDPTWILFAIIDKARGGGGAFAGVIGLINASPENLSAEIAWVLVFPAFQRTYVTTNAVGLLLRYCLELPDAPQGRGLGFRRVQWTTHTKNEASLKAAKRMGFREEGLHRWTWVLPEGFEGNGIAVRSGDPERGRPGRNSVVLSLCGDDWEQRGRSQVEGLINHVQ